MSHHDRLLRWAHTVDVDRPNDRLVLLCLIHFDMLNGDGAYPCHATVAKATGLARSTVRKALYRLRDGGLIQVVKRTRPNGSTTSNVYKFHTGKNRPRGGIPRGTPHVSPLVLTTSTHVQPLSEGRALRAHRKIEKEGPEGATALNNFRDDWDAVAVVGGLKPEASAPTPQQKPAHVQAAEHLAAVGAFDARNPAVMTGSAARRHKQQALAEVRRHKNREHKPVETWTAGDLASHWTNLLYQHGKGTSLNSKKALAARFKELQEAGVGNDRLVAISERFFAEPARHAGTGGGDYYRRFISQSSGLLAAEDDRVGLFRSALPVTSSGQSIFADES